MTCNIFSLKTAISLAVIALMSPTGPAQASLSFCNKLSNHITVAFAYSVNDAPGTSTGGDRATTAEGWTSIGAGVCAKVSEVDAKAVSLYYHVITMSGRRSGTSMLCVKNDEANFKVDEHFGSRCRAGWTSLGFARQDPTPTTTHFTITVR